MYRKRLRSSAGCARCKSRHYKCDEKRPRCSFCAKHNLQCVWPTRSKTPNITDPQFVATTSVAREVVADLGRAPNRGKDLLGLDPFHRMPVQYTDDVAVINDNLHNFFVGITQSTIPFDVASIHDDLTRGWLISAHSDEAVCSSFVTYCSWFYSERTAQDSKSTSLSLRNEARSLSILRDRVAKSGTVTEGTLLAAALHFFVATFNTGSVDQLSRVAQGLYTLVAAMGGPLVVMRTVSSSTMQSLIYADVFNSVLTARKPFLRNIGLLPRPNSYNSALCLYSAIDEDIAGCLDRDVADVLEDLHFALLFRTPSQQKRKLSSEESRYLFDLLQKISYGLCNQQSRLVTCGTVSEIAIYGMLMVKEEVLLDVVQHPIMPITILKRLRSAVSVYEKPLRGSESTVTLWATMMALVGTEFESERVWALNFIAKVLTDRYGKSWPQDWPSRLRQELQRVLWHSKIEKALSKERREGEGQ